MNEEQLLAQGADQYMSVAQIEFFKDRLHQRMQALRDRIADHQSNCKIERHADAADNASVEEVREKAMRLIDLDNRTLLQVRAALLAIEDDQYGFCALSGEEIGLKRLLLIPESLLSVDAMSASEAMNRHMRAA
ncbi:TraR/DksA family transcriptional regulator [Pseudomonas tritici]|uniref:TraR/DksA family transcriptional regulator n=1 Tax=Pseudomonas tritici TaxID=2745518 RepID=UPI00387A8AE1